MLIRDATEDDWTHIWPFFSDIMGAGETFPYPLDLTSEQGRHIWFKMAPNRTTVAVNNDGVVVGTAHMNNNRDGNGAHIASASYVVDPAHAGQGIGRALCEDSLRWAREAGFSAMQFNAVVETNAHAVALYTSLGFTIIGTVPEAFRHPTAGLVGLHIMHRAL
ncbi:MAG: GNAT family N-acetyltransferase [Corynebacteriales bacterium]|nr:GNAT family N-acetyltransferase [Mycobacteriales bacterium]